MHSLFPDASLSGRRETFVFGKASLILEILILDCILKLYLWLTLEPVIDLAPEINVANRYLVLVSSTDCFIEILKL